jgi:hypothetical protein
MQPFVVPYNEHIITEMLSRLSWLEVTDTADFRVMPKTLLTVRFAIVSQA